MTRESIVQAMGVLILVATIVVTVVAVIGMITGHSPGS
jgi:hypothetical protein